jgi:uncharacterized protein with von Willebrand factor type A (vWA) domain
MTEQNTITDQELIELQQLAEQFPENSRYEIYLLDQVERLLTNSRNQTNYLKNLSTIVTVLVVLAVLGWIITLVTG